MYKYYDNDDIRRTWDVAQHEVRFLLLQKFSFTLQGYILLN